MEHFDVLRKSTALKHLPRNRWIFGEIAKFLFQIITTKSTHVAGGSFRVLKTFLAYPPPSAIEAFISLFLCVALW